MTWRRFEKDREHWEIELDGDTLRTRDASGQGDDQSAAEEDEPLGNYVNLVGEKLWEGFAEVVAPGRPAPSLPVLDATPPAEKLATLLDAAQLAHKKAAILACVKPAVSLRVRRMAEDDFALGATRFGGRPDLPRGTAWPTLGARPLAFVAQLRLEDFDAPPLAKTGLLSFFVLADYDVNNPAEPDYLSVCRVLHHADASALERTAPPATLARTHDGERTSAPYPAHAVEQLPMLTFPPSENERFVALKLSDDEQARLEEQVLEPFAAWQGNRFPGARGTHLLGYRTRDTDREPEAILLLQCETDYSTQMRWGDADFLYYWIAPAALAAGDFSGVASNYAD